MMREVLYIDTELGILELEAEGNAITSINLVKEREADRVEGKFIVNCAACLKEYLSGKRQELDFPLKLRGTDFQISVWNELRKVPYGETRSYKDICIILGREKAARAVGNAVGKNPVLIAVPCHRIIAASGELGGFSAGLHVKKKLLELESKKDSRVFR